MSNGNRKKPTYFIPVAIIAFVLGAYFSYLDTGLSVTLIPSLISYAGVAFLFMELASGNIAIVDIKDWNRIEIGAYGKLSILLMAIGGVAGDLLTI